MSETTGDKPKTDLERAQQALRDAGFAWYHDRWSKESEITGGDDCVTIFEPPLCGGPRYFEMEFAAPLADLPRCLSAPALVQRLTDALKEIAKAEGRFSFDQLMHAENTIEDMQALANAALTAVEQANIPRMYSIEDVRQRMDEVRSAMNDPDNEWTNTGKDAGEQALFMLAERLEKPQKGGVTK